MQLDGYNSELGLAFEYQGKQHYVSGSWFHKTKKAHDDQTRRDREKAILCKKHGVTLIVVPYTERRRIEEFLQELDLEVRLAG